MSKYSLAKALASKTGTSITQAMRFVNDVGVIRARQALRSADDGVTWKLPTTAGITTGGALWWRQQTVDRAEAEAAQAEAEAEREESAESVIKMIINSDMDPEAKKALLDKMLGRNDDGNDDSGSWLRDLLGLDGEGGLGLGDELQETVIMLIVVVVVVMFVLNYTTSMAVSAGSGGVR